MSTHGGLRDVAAAVTCPGATSSARSAVMVPGPQPMSNISSPGWSSAMR
jgi:hypothetical protein